MSTCSAIASKYNNNNISVTPPTSANNNNDEEELKLPYGQVSLFGGIC